MTTPAHHAPPPPGAPQPGDGARTNSAGFITVNDRLYAPLQGLDPNDVRLGGYGWLSPTDYVGGVPQTLHPGVDLNSGTGGCNSDEGAGVVAPLGAIVRQVLWWDGSPGEGTHVWLEGDDPCLPGPTWWHFDHLLDVLVAVGQRLAPGDPVGLCGRSGGWDCAHLHVETLKGPPQYGWWQWPYGWSRGQVERAYYDPSAWWAAATALVLAEGEQPIPPEVVTVLEDWQVKGWILASLYTQAGIGYNPDSGTAQAWCDRLRQGHYPGRPRSPEQPYGEGDERGVWVEFEAGACLYRLRDGQVSWNG